MRSRLDRRLACWRDLPRDASVRPHGGWVQAIRTALGMSRSDLARRMGVAPSTLVGIEENEVRGTVRMDTLARAAEALDCDLVYALVPRRSLDDTVNARAEQVARRELAPIVNTMRLEAQGLEGEDARDALRALARAKASRADLWRDPR
ncbi:mobile mystery protein A [Cellulomonas cellasea]|uniref:mobile mystery protein A n=1 Tax=Cellulomonas cellasea TaxID=43670 RepID=UPI0025A3A2BA|nr:mobile mystery protein A [Cellulomonas cellasea]MDM8084417.1 mobile mystery protein A [Cellulomonas cellasea]